DDGIAIRAKSPVVVTVNAPLAVPLDVVTTSGPLVAPIGTVVVNTVGVTERTTARAPLKAARVTPGSKPAPVIVTKVPITPDGGSRAIMVGPRRTVNDRVAGVGSSLSARSRALTSNVWGPSESPVRVAVVAEPNAVKAPPSMRQANVRFAVG